MNFKKEKTAFIELLLYTSFHCYQCPHELTVYYYPHGQASLGLASVTLPHHQTLNPEQLFFFRNNHPRKGQAFTHREPIIHPVMM
jgi:hypothetical protein